jgi:hypothetical protein
MDKAAKIYKGIISLNGGEYEIPCYVVDDGEKVERVLSQREVVRLISGGRDGGNLNRYLSAKNIQPFLPEHLRGSSTGLKIEVGRGSQNNTVLSTKNETNSLIFRVGHVTVNGIRANDVIDICNAYLKARQLQVLQPNQSKLAEQSEMFISASAKTGIDAVVDEATSYQYFRRADELQSKLDSYIQKEYRKWTRTFPKEFFMHLYRLEGQAIPLNESYYPQRFGKYVMQFVYDTLDPDIADYLRENNPNPQGDKHHHQLLNEAGYKALGDHLLSVLGIIKASPNMDRFKESLAFAFPNARTQQIARRAKSRLAQTNLNLTFAPTQGVVTQLSLFDGEGEDLMPFDQTLKTALDYNPKED